MNYPRLTPKAREQTVIRRFDGLDCRPVSAPGRWHSVQNLTTEHAPLLCVRTRRTAPLEIDGNQAALRRGIHVYPITAMLGGEHPVALYANGTVACRGHYLQLSDAAASQQLVRMGAWVYLWPEGRYVNADRLAGGALLREGRDYGSVGQQNELLWSNPDDRKTDITLTLCDADGSELTDLTVSDTAPEGGCWIDTSEPSPALKRYSASAGAWVAVSATCVRIDAEGIGRFLRAGDGVTLRFVPPRQADEHGSGNLPLSPGMESAAALLNGEFLLEAASQDSLRIRGLFMPDEGASLRFRLTRGVGSAVPTLCAERKCPEMDFVVCCANRLWGCRCGGGVNELYASKLGDGTNWRVFQGLSTDSWAASRGAEGVFTGAAVLGGNPLFFRENALEKVFPSATGAHSVVTHALDGVQQGSSRSLAVIDEKLYYLGTNGFCVYTGTLPRRISDALGQVQYSGAAAGSCGKRYYVSADAGGSSHLLVYDTERGLWCREDDTRAGFFAAHAGRLYFNSADGALQCHGAAADSDGVAWYAESGLLGLERPEGKSLGRLTLRCKVALGASARVLVRFDGQGPWELKAVLRGNRLGSEYVPVYPRRCDHLELRLEGTGGFTLYSLAWELEHDRR